VNWDLLERRIGANEKAYQRQIIRKKIDELVQYYEQCRQARDLPSIPGAVIISCDETLRFEPVNEGSSIGILKVPEREGILRAIDGQHRLLALQADIEHVGDEPFTVPAVMSSSRLYSIVGLMLSAPVSKSTSTPTNSSFASRY
jgi:DGQHR domain-containing protein